MDRTLLLIGKRPSTLLYHSKVGKIEEHQVQETVQEVSVSRSPPPLDVAFEAKPRKCPRCSPTQEVHKRYLPQPIEPYKPLRDTAFDIEQLSGISRPASHIGKGAYRYRCHSGLLSKTIDSAILNPLDSYPLKLPPLRDSELRDKDLPLIRGLFPELELRWQAKPLIAHTASMPK